jgi:nitrous oxidase accessory protein NosD
VLVGIGLPGRDGIGAPAALPERIDARDAGAIGDGHQDDAAALQKALDRLAPAGGVLYLPAGIYLVGSPLVIRGDHVTLKGDGATLRARDGFADDAKQPGPIVRGRSYRGSADAPTQRGLAVVDLTFDGGGQATGAVRFEHARDVEISGNRVRAMRAGGDGAIVVRSASDDRSDSGEIVVADNIVELDQATSGIVLRNVVNCRVRDNRVHGSGTEGGHGIDLTLSQGCAVTGNMLLTVDVGCLADESNHLQILGNYVFAPRIGFRAGRRPGGKGTAHNNVYVNNRVLTGGAGFVVRGSGMILVANYAAFVDPGPAIWVQRGGTHDAVVANNPSMALTDGIRFDASDGVITANVPTSNGGSGIEVNGERVAITGNAISSCPTGIRLGPAARSCTVVGNTVRKASENALVAEGEGHRVRDNIGPGGPAVEVGPAAFYGSGEADVRGARTAVEAGRKRPRVS